MTHLVRLALQKNSSYKEDESELLKCLRPTLTRTSQVLLVNCVQPGCQNFQHTLSSVKGCSKVRDKIVKSAKAKRLNPFNASQSGPDIEQTDRIKAQLQHVLKDAEVYENQIQNMPA